MNNISTYQIQSARTMVLSTDIRSDDRHNRMIMILGLVGEAGEIAENIKKVEGHGHRLNRTELVEELGDLMWYVAAIATNYHIDLDEVLTHNIAKLQNRYPEGFSHEASRNRAE